MTGKNLNFKGFFFNSNQNNALLFLSNIANKISNYIITISINNHMHLKFERQLLFSNLKLQKYGCSNNEIKLLNVSQYYG